jgi:hypothetical protein
VASNLPSPGDTTLEDAPGKSLSSPLRERIKVRVIAGEGLVM